MSHTIDIRVYYEDTDAGGIVYHASYIRFMERARTEWLRALGFESQALMRDRNVSFVVARIDIAYKRPAFLDDLLTAGAVVAAHSEKRLTLRQTITRGDTLVTDATVELAMIDLTSKRAAKIPDDVIAKLLI